MKQPKEHIGYYDTEGEAIRLAELMKARLDREEAQKELNTGGKNA